MRLILIRVSWVGEDGLGHNEVRDATVSEEDGLHTLTFDVPEDAVRVDVSPIV